MKTYLTNFTGGISPFPPLYLPNELLKLIREAPYHNKPVYKILNKSDNFIMLCCVTCIRRYIHTEKSGHIRLSDFDSLRANKDLIPFSFFE